MKRRTFRVIKNKNFTTIDNRYLFVHSLSLQAKGLLTIMLSRPDDWEMNLRELAKHSTNGLSSHRKAYRELDEHGYVYRNEFKTDEGQFACEYFTYENPDLNPFFGNGVSEVSNQEEPRAKIECGEQDLFDPPTACGFPHTETETRDSEHGEPNPGFRTQLNTKELITNKPITEELNTKEEEKEEISFDNILPKAKELIQNHWGEYFALPRNELNKIQEFLLASIPASGIYSLIQKLIAIKKSEKFRGEKFWLQMPVNISSAWSFQVQIFNTYSMLEAKGYKPKNIGLEIPATQEPRRVPEIKKTYTSFEAWAKENLSSSTYQEVLKFNSESEITSILKIRLEQFRATYGDLPFRERGAA